MTIDTSGKWWTGSSPSDVGEYLRALSASGYPVTEFRQARCHCGHECFSLAVEQDEGIARRTCEKCSAEHFICDSGEHWTSKLRLKKLKCPTCRSMIANVGVGFALYEDRQSVQWLYVGHRCAGCGTLGSMVDWKVGYEPSLQLLEGA